MNIVTERFPLPTGIGLSGITQLLVDQFSRVRLRRVALLREAAGMFLETDRIVLPGEPREPQTVLRPDSAPISAYDHFGNITEQVMVQEGMPLASAHLAAMEALKAADARALVPVGVMVNPQDVSIAPYTYRPTLLGMPLFLEQRTTPGALVVFAGLDLDANHNVNATTVVFVATFSKGAEAPLANGAPL